MDAQMKDMPLITCPSCGLKECIASFCLPKGNDPSLSCPECMWDFNLSGTAEGFDSWFTRQVEGE